MDRNIRIAMLALLGFALLLNICLLLWPPASGIDAQVCAMHAGKFERVNADTLWGLIDHHWVCVLPGK